MDSPVQPVGPPVSSAPEEFCSSTLLFLKDVLSGKEFLVDSGASVSVFPGPRSSSNDGVSLLTADGSPMVCSGTRIIPVHFSCGSASGSRIYSWNFQFHADCPDDVVIRASPGPQPAFKSVSFLSAPREIQELLVKYLDVLSSNGFTASKPCHGVRHHLLTHPGPPVFTKAQRLDQEKLAAAQEEFSAMEKA